MFTSHLQSFAVELCKILIFLYPFIVKYANIKSIYLKMSAFCSKNVRYPRYQDTDLLQLCLL